MNSNRDTCPPDVIFYLFCHFLFVFISYLIQVFEFWKKRGVTERAQGTWPSVVTNSGRLLSSGGMLILSPKSQIRNLC
ncbi:hypothetical protein HanXRQr2_Chr09g0374881 [Helianthus annuus]|uniref:Uncharacterized protein n=1 Tax=Helianthus annuus TaxID=4232 RepID=A0A251TUK5_HELAN|nr:hypothetical protein HanXRQr2_Chr09g0374881 [Helianthus annuus]